MSIKSISLITEKQYVSDLVTLTGNMRKIRAIRHGDTNKVSCNACKMFTVDWRKRWGCIGSGKGSLEPCTNFEPKPIKQCCAEGKCDTCNNCGGE